MMKNLVIVESPAKAKTIEKFLGKDFTVLSSMGHIRDLKKKGISIDFKDNFKPEYEIPAEKQELVKKLKSAAKDADVIWLASDEDREGEAIAWHLAEVLGLDPAHARRIVFHEITKPALLHAIENPRTIDLDRVNAQQARRVLDRIVGFELSPVLWKKIKPNLSAGRVQSVVLRLICERENEIKNFKTETFYRINARFNTGKGDLKAELNRRMPDEQSAEAFLKTCSDSDFRVSDISVRPLKRAPLPPFTTSTLQQEAASRLGFSVSTTMRVAQSLYEAGLITYMRTDSMNLSDTALGDIARTIEERYGNQSLKIRKYHTSSKGAQEAHEAIRPTYVTNRTISGTSQEEKLYDLIWRRTVACQMVDAQLEKTQVEIEVHPRSGSLTDRLESELNGSFKAEGVVVKVPGFLEVYGSEAGDEQGTLLPPVTVGQDLKAEEITATQRFTQAPPRYNEKAMVKKMEELGIGRPSTYATTISTIQQRDYVRRGERDGEPRDYNVITLSDGKITEEVRTENTGSDKGKLVPTDIGMVVNAFLTEYFPDILDYNFTAKVEEKFDDIAEGKLPWEQEMSEFYDGFHPNIEKISTLHMDHKVGERALGTDPKSGKPVAVKIGRFGPVVQIGEATDEEKPQFASLRPDQSIATITLEEALKLFDLPRVVGEFEGKEMKAAIGRFGPYISHAGTFVSIPKELAPQSITAEEAIALILAKREAEANKFIKEFPEIPGLQVLNGRFGPYMAYKPEGARKATNYKIPKTQDPRELTAEQAQELMKAQDAAPKKKAPARKKS
ncbi:MAG: type I DNA topoisomerase [Bacteroidales bacterium]|nr:type I DNA topoisomerase [Bacteroidales bacterium]